jgi:fructose-1,6-bisphosphatase/inositol monophosphatase family enzyme
MIKEAGGVITRFDGSEEDGELGTYFVASNNEILHKKIIKIISEINGHF